MKTSAGIAMYRRTGPGVEVLLVHPGGPLWAKKDLGAWSFPKGEYTDGEDPLTVAQREFHEEIGSPVEGEFRPLGDVTQRNGKVVSVWAVEGTCNADDIRSNTFVMEWPPKSGKQAEFPEVDRAAWYAAPVAKKKLIPAQAAFVDRLLGSLGLVVVALMLLVAPARAQSKSTPIVIGTKMELKSAILGEMRPVWIHLPTDYGRLPGQRYPVIYLLDGDDHFTELTGIVQRLAGNARMPDAIIVALPNTKDRTHDLTPAAASDSSRFPWYPSSRDSVKQRFTTRGGADRMLSFITSELAPWIDRRYRTAPYRVLIGHSFGGLFVLNALARHPESFRSYVALSPSLWWDNGRYVKTLEEQLPRSQLAGTSLYMTTGAMELEGEMIAPARELAATFDRTRPADFRWWYRVMPGEEHNTNPHRSTYDALETIFAGWQPHDSLLVGLAYTGDSTLLVAHFAKLSREYGFTVPVPIFAIDDFAHYLLTIHMTDQALRMLRFNVAHAPTVPAVYAGLADGLDSAGMKTEARRAIEEAVRRADAARDTSAVGYRKRLMQYRLDTKTSVDGTLPRGGGKASSRALRVRKTDHADFTDPADHRAVR